ncbi:MAG TPA: ABC transporter substrate-binding protein, partial [Solirubrobacterales bacterium]
MERLRLLLALAMATALLAGCGDSDSSEADEEPWTFQALHLALDGRPGPETAGVLMAHKLGYFEELGIGLEISSPVEPDRPVGYVMNDSVDISITNEPQVVIAQDEEVPIAAVGSLVPEPTLAMIWLKKSKIKGIADLEGKTIAVPGVPFQEAFLETVLARANLKLSDVKVKEAS